MFIMLEASPRNEADGVIMIRPRPDEIDPMVPEIAAATDRTGGESHVASDGGVARAAETDAPLVPDLT